MPTADPIPDAPAATQDNPEAYIARDRRRALSAGVELPDRVSGSALFADISGFTPLTEALAKELGPQRGAEELTVNIGRVFQAVIGELDAFGGDVIYFSGDAITCWIDGDDGTLACAAAIAMQEAIGRTGNVVTPGGAEVKLAMKVAIAVGDARRFIVGDPESQLIDVLAGRLIDDLAAAEHFAQKGEVVLEPSAMRRLGDRVSLGELRHDEETDRTYAVLDQLNVEVPRTPVVEPPPLSEDLVRSWLLPPVFERIRTGRGEFLTELRPAIPVFLRFTGIDYDNDPEAIPQLDEFVRGAQKIMSGYGGNVLQLTLGDKGAYLYGVFGSPIAHEDDAARAAGAALELRDLEKSTAAREIQVGVTRGTLRSGTYGHEMRRTFVCLGDEVNLSARLMSAAPPGRIYVSQRIREGAGDGFIWEQLPDMKVKGKSQPVSVFSLGGSLERSSRRKTRFELRLVGRKAELEQLTIGLETALQHRGQIVGIAAEAGLGKSRLVAEFVRAARRRGIFVAFGECQAFGTNTGYFVWREIWRRLFRLEDGDSEAAQIAQVEAELAAIDPGYVARAPLLHDLLELPIPDNDLTRSFDPKLRKASLEDLLTGCLRARAATEPIVVVLEDCHWIDELSRDLLQVLARASGDLRLLFLLAYRPAAEKGGGLGLERQQNLAEIELDHLDDAEAAEVVRSKLEQVLGQGETPSDELVQLVTERAGGNPLYVEELVSFIASQQIDLHDRAAMA
ncbi:MAG: AAA family ATPase, partial [Chloroflexota bacterium]